MIIGTIKADKAAALKSETLARITETGAYIGRIVQAEQHESKNGAAMLGFYFETNEGQTAWLSLCVIKGDGEESFGMGIFHSMMTVAKVDAVEWTPGKYRNMQGEKVDGHRGRAIEGKPIGLLLEREEREYTRNGEVKIGFDMVIRRAFDPATGLTVKEMEANETTPKVIQNMLQILRDKPKPVRKLQGQAAASSSPASMPPDPPVDDDMPF